MIWVKATALAVFGLVVALGLHFAVLLLGDNFHEVVAGELYRSGQLSPQSIAKLDSKYQFGTIINLRGENASSDWYRREVSEAERLGIAHVDFKMSSRSRLSLDRMKDLVAIMRDAKKPILVHCLNGIDRTGLAAMLYANQIAGMDEDIAEFQLSLLYGHIGIPLVSRAYAMDQSWLEIEDAFGIEDKS